MPTRTNIVIACLTIIVLAISSYFAYRQTPPIPNIPGPSPTATMSPIPSSIPTTINSHINLLKPLEAWFYLPGATPEPDGIRINNLTRNIVNQDGTPNQPNYPINLHGPALQFKDNFQLTAHLQDITGNASIQLYSQPPRIYDEYRFDSPNIRLNFQNSELIITIWDGIKQQPTSTTKFPIPTKSDYQLKLNYQDKQLNIEIDDQLITQIPGGNIFSAGQLWFGADSTATHGSFLLTQLQVTSPGDQDLSIYDLKSISPEPNSQAFQQLANQKYPTKLIGAAISLGPLVSDYAYNQLATSGWYGSWTTENALKPQFVHPQPDTYTFQEADLLLEIAQAHGIQVHGHTLVFGEANPQWMQDTPYTQRETVMLEHISNVMGHFRNQIPTWDVINEPLHPDFEDGSLQLRDHIWHQAMGPEYIEKALRAARAADPNAKLFINEWGLEADGDRWTGMLTLIESLLKKNVPLDGLGFQAHVYERGDEVDPQILNQHFQQLAQLGRRYNRTLVARVSELDVHGHNSLLQAQQFAQVLKTCMESPTCTSFTTWGISEKYGSTSWVDDFGHLQIGDGLPFGKNNEPLNAVSAMQAILQQ